MINLSSYASSCSLKLEYRINNQVMSIQERAIYAPIISTAGIDRYEASLNSRAHYTNQYKRTIRFYQNIKREGIRDQGIVYRILGGINEKYHRKK